MSTAPIKITYGNSSYNKKFMGIKETKKELKSYSQQLEGALAKTRTKLIEIEKDHEILNKTYLRELKKGDRVHRTLQKVKQHVQNMFKQSSESQLCRYCIILQDVQDLARIIKERAFDASNEGDQASDPLDLSFNQQQNKKNEKALSRGTNSPIARSRQREVKEDNKQFQKITSVIMEEEFDYKNCMKSPNLIPDMYDNKISAIGYIDDQTGRKDSPFLDQDNLFDLQSVFKKKTSNVAGQRGSFLNDEFNH